MINIVNYNVIIYIMNINIKHQQHQPQQQRYSNDNVFTKREHILITHIRVLECSYSQTLNLQKIQYHKFTSKIW